MLRQVSVSSLPEDQQDGAMAEAERAGDAYPSVLVRGHLLHVFEIGGRWDVWLNCEDANFTGVCIAADHETRDGAVAEAVGVLEAVTAVLQQQA